MKREDEIFRRLDKEKPIIKQTDGETQRSGRRSIGSLNDEGFFTPATVRERTKPSAARENAERLSSAAPDKKAEIPAKRAQRASAPRSAAVPPEGNETRVRTRAEAPSDANPERVPVRQSVRTHTPANAPETRKTAPPQNMGSTASNAREQSAPKQERTSPQRKGPGIMPPVSLKNPSAMEPPYKIESAAQNRRPLPQRHELKFYINYCDYVILRQKMKGLLHTDEHAGEDGGYFIRSLYFDDIYNSAVTEKEAGVQFRHKYRIRTYNLDKGFIRFEKKIKTGQFISKDSFPLSYKEYCRFIGGDMEFLLHKPEPLAKEVYLAVRQRNLKPCVVVDYYREPFVMNYETVRITFDRDVRAGTTSWDIFDPALPVMPLLEKGTVVLEVKFAKSLPDYLRRVINSVEALQGSAISKYIICRQYD